MKYLLIAFVLLACACQSKTAPVENKSTPDENEVAPDPVEVELNNLPVPDGENETANAQITAENAEAELKKLTEEIDSDATPKAGSDEPTTKPE